MTEDQKAETGNCDQHQNCMYRIQLLEKWREAVEKKMDCGIKLLIGNLVAVCTLLLSSLIGALIWMVRTH